MIVSRAASPDPMPMRLIGREPTRRTRRRLRLWTTSSRWASYVILRGVSNPQVDEKEEKKEGVLKEVEDSDGVKLDAIPKVSMELVLTSAFSNSSSGATTSHSEGSQWSYYG